MPRRESKSERRAKRSVSLPATSWPTAEEARASRLFSPIRVGGFRARTRTWVPAMVPWRATGDGAVTPAVLDWYGRFADGRPGVIVVEATGVREIASGPLLRIGHDRFLPGLRELVRTVRERSAGETRLLIQCIDFLTVRRRPAPDKFFARFLNLRTEHRERLAALPGCQDLARGSAEQVRAALLALDEDKIAAVLSSRELDDLRMGYRERVDDTHLEHVANLPTVLPEFFAAAARRAREAGFDGVELHYAHAYTMSSFLSRTNKREDGYGTTLEGRLRLPVEVYERVRAEVGADYTLGCRFLSDEVIAGGNRIEDALLIAERFARAGMDFLSLSKGGKFDDAKQPRVGHAAYPYTGPSGHECIPTVRIDERGPFGRQLPNAAAVRAHLRAKGHATPVIAAGGIHSFEQAEKALRDGVCDIIGAARQSLADPDWFLKVERGRGADVRRCLYTNYCEGLDQKHQQVTCQLWDREPARSGELDVPYSSDGRRRLVAPPWLLED